MFIIPILSNAGDFFQIECSADQSFFLDELRSSVFLRSTVHHMVKSSIIPSNRRSISNGKEKYLEIKTLAHTKSK